MSSALSSNQSRRPSLIDLPGLMHHRYITGDIQSATAPITTNTYIIRLLPPLMVLFKSFSWPHENDGYNALSLFLIVLLLDAIRICVPDKYRQIQGFHQVQEEKF